MSLFRPMQDLDRSKMGEEFYLGVVVSNSDPEGLHRVQVRIQELHGTPQEIPDSLLPWAMHFRPTLLGGGENLSLTAIPRVGSEVIITHVRGDIYQPAYVFELAHAKTKIEQGQEDYPDSYVFRDSKDNHWHVNLAQDKLNVKFNGTQCTEITADQETTIGGNRTTQIDGDRSTNVTGDSSDTINGSETSTVALDRTENISGSASQTLGGAKTLTTTSFTINAPVVNVVGGTVNVTGGDVVADGVSLKTHTHSHGTPFTSPPI